MINPCPYVTQALTALRLDLATGYWQVKMESASQEKTAFVTHDGH